MKKVRSDELRPEYRREELGAGVRGKYIDAFKVGTNLVLSKKAGWQMLARLAIYH